MTSSCTETVVRPDTNTKTCVCEVLTHYSGRKTAAHINHFGASMLDSFREVK